MIQDEIIEMARQAGLLVIGASNGGEAVYTWPAGITEEIEAFAKLVAEKEREVVANWIMGKGFATGHGDSIVDLLDQLEWQIIEKEREACAKVCEYYAGTFNAHRIGECADAIRARGQA